MFVANQIVLYAGLVGGANGAANWMWAPLDGSAVAKVLTFPVSGTNVAPNWFHSHSRRVSKDGKVVVWPRGHNGANSGIDHDL